MCIDLCTGMHIDMYVDMQGRRNCYRSRSLLFHPETMALPISTRKPWHYPLQPIRTKAFCVARLQHITNGHSPNTCPKRHTQYLRAHSSRAQTSRAATHNYLLIIFNYFFGTIDVYVHRQVYRQVYRHVCRHVP